tara:strand:+ start:27 stop:398 length:372 start_codon:yes stop_codon:yes gene_type:complete
MNNTRPIKLKGESVMTKTKIFGRIYITPNNNNNNQVQEANIIVNKMCEKLFPEKIKVGSDMKKYGVRFDFFGTPEEIQKSVKEFMQKYNLFSNSANVDLFRNDNRKEMWLWKYHTLRFKKEEI